MGKNKQSQQKPQSNSNNKKQSVEKNSEDNIQNPPSKNKKTTKTNNSINNNNTNKIQKKESNTNETSEPQKFFISLTTRSQRSPEQIEMTDSYLDLAKLLFDFTQNSDETAIAFPRTLDSKTRAIIHDIGDEYQLIHKSVTKQDSRELIVTKAESLNYNQLALKLPADLDKVHSLKVQTIQSKRDRVPVGMTCILEDFLYLGSGRDARDRSALDTLRITAICNVTKEWANSSHKGITMFNVKMVDNEEENLELHLKGIFEFLETCKKKQQRVLVHCVMGKSRSASIVIAYLMQYEKMALKDAFVHVAQRRLKVCKICPNSAFWTQLQSMEKLLFGSVTLENYSSLPLFATSTETEENEPEIDTQNNKKSDKKQENSKTK